MGRNRLIRSMAPHGHRPRKGIGVRPTSIRQQLPKEDRIRQRRRQRRRRVTVDVSPPASSSATAAFLRVIRRRRRRHSRTKNERERGNMTLFDVQRRRDGRTGWMAGRKTPFLPSFHRSFLPKFPLQFGTVRPTVGIFKYVDTKLSLANP